jgi:hypothetical protein
MAPMTDEEREARAEERRDIRRATRIGIVFGEIEKETKAGKRITTAELSRRTGFSENLVKSTIHLVNRTMDDGYGKTQADVMIEYAPGRPSDGTKGGWWVAKTWRRQERWRLTLHRHATTRVEHLAEEADVAEALMGDAPTGLAGLYRAAIFILDQAGALIAGLEGVKGVPAVVKARKRAKLIS